MGECITRSQIVVASMASRSAKEAWPPLTAIQSRLKNDTRRMKEAAGRTATLRKRNRPRCCSGRGPLHFFSRDVKGLEVRSSGAVPAVDEKAVWHGPG